MPFHARRSRRSRRARPWADLAAPEPLESRDLMAYTGLGISLPDLQVSGFAAPTAAYGGPLAVTIDVRNIGATSSVDPLALLPGSKSHADAGPVDVAVYIMPTRAFGIDPVQIGSIHLSGVAQNSFVRASQTFTLPAQPHGFPAPGGQFYVGFQIDPAHLVPDLDRTDKFAVAPASVQVLPNLPDIAAIGLDIPPTLQPGDTIQPNIRIENLGTVDSAVFQKPVVVDLVASLTGSVGPGSTLLASYQIPNIPALAEAPTKNFVVGDANLDLPVTPAGTSNIVTIFGAPVTLPKGPAIYNIGVVIDLGTKFPQIHEIGNGPDLSLSLIRQVGPPIRGLPPAGVISAPAPSTNVFPTPPFGVINQGQTTTTTTTGTTTTTTTTTGTVTTAALAATPGTSARAIHRAPVHAAGLRSHRAALTGRVVHAVGHRV